MSDDKPDNDSSRSLEQQLQEMLRRANLTFMTPRQAPAEAPPAADEQEPSEDRLKPIREFDLKPRDVRDHLDRFVIQQDEAKKVLSVALCDHYNHVRACIENPSLQEAEYAKHNILMLGPTGVGKTYMMRCAARLIGVPFVKADATKFSETGYVGHDVEDLVRDLVKAADGDVDLAQYGIVFMDEIDKIASSSSAAGKDVSGRGVQINLLKLMEDTDVSLFSQTDIIGQMQAVMNMQRGGDPGKRSINTRHILFIVSGAFDHLGDLVRKRLQTSSIGFASDDPAKHDEGDILRQATTRDFMDYGFEAEFIGRLPVRVVFDALSAGDLAEIMKRSEGSILGQYRADFDGYDIALQMTDEAIAGVARRAHAEKTGARGLMTVMERLLRDFKFELPSTTIARVDVTEETVANPDAALAELLAERESARRESLRDDVKRFAQRFQREHGIRLTFTRDAATAIVALCLERNESVATVCAERFRDLEYGVKLIARNSGRNSFTITKTMLDNPGEELSRRVAESFVKSGGDSG